VKPAYLSPIGTYQGSETGVTGKVSDGNACHGPIRLTGGIKFLPITHAAKNTLSPFGIQSAIHGSYITILVEER
jgi:hypothetical protein